MRTALLSDIHGNLEALEAVLRDAEAAKVERFVCLGDTVDYGPDPVACLERVQQTADLWLIGNHEVEVLAATDTREPFYDGVLSWTLSQLDGTDAWARVLARVEAEGAEGAATRITDDAHYTHASGADPIGQYVWPAHEVQYLIYNTQVDERLVEFLDAFQRPHGFLGHTHVPAVLTDRSAHRVFSPYVGETRRDPLRTFVGANAIFFVPRGERAVIEGLADVRAVINPGSVGQPRRVGDPRASYGIFDGDRLELRRVDYDRRKTKKKLARCGFDKPLKQHLLERLETGI